MVHIQKELPFHRSVHFTLDVVVDEPMILVMLMMMLQWPVNRHMMVYVMMRMIQQMALANQKAHDGGVCYDVR